jgi:alpha-tubulin suppressor-like RCC1 family protein
VTGLSSGVTGISAKGNTTCALLSTGITKCWGKNNFGQLGLASSIHWYSSPQITPFANANQVSVGATALAITISNSPGVNCALTPADPSCYSTLAGQTCTIASAGGGVKCIGNNLEGQFGDGTTPTYSNAYSLVPQTTTGLSNVSQLATGALMTCALITGGSVSCWGNNYFGQCGANSASTTLFSATATGITTANQITAGSEHNCALLSGGTVQCWGNNSFGQIGDGTTVQKIIPTSVSGLTASYVSAGEYTNCAIDSSIHNIKCWGANDFGQIGNNGKVSPTITPTPVIWNPN